MARLGALDLPYFTNAYYLGCEIPTERLTQPHIIEDPLRKLYQLSSFRLYKRLSSSCCEVQIRIYNSGVVFVGRVAKKKAEWFPIQHLYCAACLRPDIDDGKLVFKQYEEPLSSKARKRQAVFAVALRELECGKRERKVIRCYAFLLANPSVAKELVIASRNAFSDKSGWNHPISDLEIVVDRSRISLDCLDIDDYEQLQEDAQNRDEALRKKPVPAGAPIVSEKKSIATRNLQSAPPTPRQNLRRLVGASLSVVRPIPQHFFGRPPNAMSPRQSLMLHPGPLKVSKTASVTGFPLSRSSSKTTSASFGQPSPRSINIVNSESPYNAHQKIRQHMSVSSKGHKIIASSEPQDFVNGTGPRTTERKTYNVRRRPSGDNSKHAVILDWSKLPNGMMNGGANGAKPTNGESNGTERQNPFPSTIEEFNPEIVTPLKVRGKRVSKKKKGFAIINSDDLDITANGYIEGHSVADMPM